MRAGARRRPHAGPGARRRSPSPLAITRDRDRRASASSPAWSAHFGDVATDLAAAVGALTRHRGSTRRPDTVNPLEELVAERIGRSGPLPFDEVDGPGALRPRARLLRDRRPGRSPGRLPHQPRGRAAVRRGARPGARRRGGRSWAGPTRSWWSRPAPGPGRWPAPCCRPTPACAPALRYVLVERSAALRVEHGRARSQLDPTAFGLGPARRRRRHRAAEPGRGGRSSSASAELPGARPAGGRAGQRAARQPGLPPPRSAASDGWQEVRVGDRRRRGAPRRGARPGRGRPCRRSARSAPDAPAGARVPVQDEAGRWLRDALAPRRRPVAGSSCFDYADAHRRRWRRARSRVAAHLRRPRPRRPAARRPRPAGHHLRGVRRPAGPGACAGREIAPGRLARARTASTSWWPRAPRVVRAGPRRRPRGAAGPQPGERGRGPPRPRPASAPSASSSGAS